MKAKHYGVLVLVLGVGLLVGDWALASRLENAARAAQSSILQIAQLTSGVGIGLGAILMQFGAGGIGRMVLQGGVIGVVASFGGPAIVEFIRGFF